MTPGWGSPQKKMLKNDNADVISWILKQKKRNYNSSYRILGLINKL